MMPSSGIDSTGDRSGAGKLHEHGGEPVRQRGSHQIWRCGHCQTVVPLHAGDIPAGTLRSIERDLEPCLGPRWLTR